MKYKLFRISMGRLLLQCWFYNKVECLNLAQFFKMCLWIWLEINHQWSVVGCNLNLFLLVLCLCWLCFFLSFLLLTFLGMNRSFRLDSQLFVRLFCCWFRLVLIALRLLRFFRLRLVPLFLWSVKVQGIRIVFLELYCSLVVVIKFIKS